MKEIKLNVNGMVCGGCENRVKNALENIDGVESVSASYESCTVVVTASEEVEKSLLEEKITDLGFEVVKED